MIPIYPRQNPIFCLLKGGYTPDPKPHILSTSVLTGDYKALRVLGILSIPIDSLRFPKTLQEGCQGFGWTIAWGFRVVRFEGFRV